MPLLAVRSGSARMARQRQRSLIRVASARRHPNFPHHRDRVSHHQHGKKLAATALVSTIKHAMAMPMARSVSSRTNSSVNLGKRFSVWIETLMLHLYSYKPFGPTEAVCRPKKSFWEVMPTHCLPAGFNPPNKWNMDTANLDAYFMRTEEWDAMTAEEGDYRLLIQNIINI